MAKVFIICGHGAGDPGACAGGCSEADLVRRLASRMKALGGGEVVVGDTGRNWYADNGIGRGHCPRGVPVIELHMDSAGAGAKGGHVIIKAGFNPDGIDNAIASFLGSFMPGRSKLVVGRSDLANPNRAASVGVNYRLVECGFISDDGDRGKFLNQMDDLARGLLAAFGVDAGSAPAPAPTPAPAPQPQPAPKPTPSRKPLGKVDVRYALRNLNGGWNSEIVNFGDGPEGFAGVPNGQHDLLYVKVDKGSVKYRAHIVGGGWLDWVTKGDPADTVHGCAGVPGRAIDGVQVYYTTPDGFEYQQAWYRSQTKCRAGWLPVCCDDGGSVDGYDGWAGILGEPLDRLQIAIGDRDPF